VPTSAAVALGNGTVLSLSIPAHRFSAGSVATMTASLADALETTSEAPDVTFTIADARGVEVSDFTWSQDAFRKDYPTCARCHTDRSVRPIPARTELVWPLRFVVPDTPGRYTVTASASLSDTPSVTQSLVFYSAKPSVAATASGGAAPVWRMLGPGEPQALTLMAKYRLHPSGEPYRAGGTVTVNDLTGCAAPSKAIGLNLRRHLGETLQTLAYTLQDPSSGGTVTALFYVSGDRVVGAALTDQRLGGRPVALSDRMDFTP